jgi:hypothetical protein
LLRRRFWCGFGALVTVVFGSGFAAPVTVDKGGGLKLRRQFRRLSRLIGCWFHGFSFVCCHYWL